MCPQVLSAVCRGLGTLGSGSHRGLTCSVFWTCLVQFITKLRRLLEISLRIECMQGSLSQGNPNNHPKTFHHHPSPASPNSISVLFAWYTYTLMGWEPVGLCPESMLGKQYLRVLPLPWAGLDKRVLSVPSIGSCRGRPNRILLHTARPVPRWITHFSDQACLQCSYPEGCPLHPYPGLPLSCGAQPLIHRRADAIIQSSSLSNKPLCLGLTLVW